MPIIGRRRERLQRPSFQHRPRYHFILHALKNVPIDLMTRFHASALHCRQSLVVVLYRIVVFYAWKLVALKCFTNVFRRYLAFLISRIASWTRPSRKWTLDCLRPDEFAAKRLPPLARWSEGTSLKFPGRITNICKVLLRFALMN